jgi:hypothetical protein
MAIATEGVVPFGVVNGLVAAKTFGDLGRLGLYRHPFHGYSRDCGRQHLGDSLDVFHG